MDGRILNIAEAIKVLRKNCSPGTDFCYFECPIHDLCCECFEGTPREWKLDDEEEEE